MILSLTPETLRSRRVPETLPLFPEDAGLELKERLQVKLRALAAQKIFLGASSWKYPGWLGQIYTPDRYYVRGRFSKPRFERECLAEYAETFPIVCGDFAFYQFPSRDFWKKLFDRAPEQLQFAFKVPEEITVHTFPEHSRYGARAALPNPTFLNRELFLAEFIDLLTPYASRIALLIFEFGASNGRIFAPLEFAGRLSEFFSALPPAFRYAVEIRNPELFDPAYLAALHRNGIAHVFNAWSKMPLLSVQLQQPAAFTTNFTAARALLRQGRKYEQAVRLFAPYCETQDVNQEVRDALLNLLLRAKSRAEPTYIFVNNRLEGNAPNTIYALVEET